MISPLQAHLNETLTSLKFATKVHNTHIGTAKQKKIASHWALVSFACFSSGVAPHGLSTVWMDWIEHPCWTYGFWRNDWVFLAVGLLCALSSDLTMTLWNSAYGQRSGVTWVCILVWRKSWNGHEKHRSKSTDAKDFDQLRVHSTFPSRLLLSPSKIHLNNFPAFSNLNSLS